MTKLEDNTAPQDDNEVGGEDWDAAFDEFYEEELKDDKQDDNDSLDSDGDNDDDASGDDDSVDADKDDKKDDEKNNSEDEDDVKNNDDKKEEEADPDAEQKRIVREALKEVYAEQGDADQAMQETISEALSIVRPEGVPDPRVDSDGDRITGPADVEKLYNPATGELYTPEEARQWYDKATQQYEANIKEAQTEAVQVANTSIKMKEGREAVLRNYGDFINENPEIAKKVLMSYMATMKIKGEGENQYVYDAPLDMLAFYNDHMYPYVELAERKKEADEAAAAAEQKKQEDLKRAKAHRDESRDFPTNVSDDATKTGDDMDWDDAFKQYYGSK